MSHFAVMVVGEDIKGQLAPFQENNMRDCPKEYLKFHDLEDEIRKEYEEESSPEFYDSSSCSAGMEVNEPFFDRLRNLPIGKRAIITFGKNDLQNFAGYFTKDKTYRVTLRNSKGEGKSGYVLAGEVWVKVVDVLQTNHPDENICFEGTVRLEVIAPPKEIPNKEKYGSLEEYAKEYHGQGERDETYNRYGYWENPNAKWDWYQTGGRWGGFLWIKPEFQHLYEGDTPNFSPLLALNERSAKRMEETLKECRVDSAKKGHVDWEAMMQVKRDKAAKRYDFVYSNIFKGAPPNETWEVVRSEDEKDMDAKRDAYWAQPRCKLMKEWTSGQCKGNRDIADDLDISLWDVSPDEYLCTKEEYVQREGYKAIVCFAFLQNGKWAERGEMGFWASVSNEKDNWEDIFHNLLGKVSDDEYITIVDCHI